MGKKIEKNDANIKLFTKALIASMRHCDGEIKWTINILGQLECIRPTTGEGFSLLLQKLHGCCRRYKGSCKILNLFKPSLLYLLREEKREREREARKNKRSTPLLFQEKAHY